MFNIKTLNKISSKGLSRLSPEKYNCGDNVEAPHGILVRSASMHGMELPEELLAIARAGAGVNNIPVDDCTRQGIAVFNTPGANANAVKELVIGALIMSSRDIVGGIEWAQGLKGKGDDVPALVEKGKSSFVGPEIEGKKLGVIGLGAVGVLVANAAAALGMEVYGVDPYISVDAAWMLSRAVHRASDYRFIYENCDYITLHAPLLPDTRGMINAEAFALMKKGVRIINLARGELVNDQDMLKALEEGVVASYVTDFPNDNMLGVKGVIPIPHLGASTPESEENCAVMAVKQIKDYLENGNIKNSVNLPNAYLDRSGSARLTVIHRNIPNMVGSITAELAGAGINIENMVSKSKKDYAYMIIDLAEAPSNEIVDKLSTINGIIKTRLI